MLYSLMSCRLLASGTHDLFSPHLCAACAESAHFRTWIFVKRFHISACRCLRLRYFTSETSMHKFFIILYYCLSSSRCMLTREVRAWGGPEWCGPGGSGRGGGGLGVGRSGWERSGWRRSGCARSVCGRSRLERSGLGAVGWRRSG